MMGHVEVAQVPVLMSGVAEYTRLEAKVVELLGVRGTISEKVQYLDQMDRLWATMTPEEQRQAKERTNGL